MLPSLAVRPTTGHIFSSLRYAVITSFQAPKPYPSLTQKQLAFWTYLWYLRGTGIYSWLA